MAKSQILGGNSGIAMLEFAIVLPLFLLIFTLFWDTMVDRICEIRHQAAATQISLVFKAPAIKVSIPVVAGVPTVTLAKLSVPELNDPTNGFLPKINTLFNDIMDRIGSGASSVAHNAAVELWYYDICNNSNGCPGNIEFGSTTGQRIAGGPANPQRFFTSPGPALGKETGPTACFGLSNPDFTRQRTNFNTYVATQRSKIRSPANGNLPFGTKLVDVPEAGNIAAIEQYADLKPILFLALCSKAPKFYNSNPHITYITLFLDKEIGYVPAP